MHSYRLCQHIKTNGLQCESPALGRARYCHFHRQMHDLRRRKSGKTAAFFQNTGRNWHPF